MKKLKKAIKLNNKLERVINSIKSDILEHFIDSDWKVGIHLGVGQPKISVWRGREEPAASITFTVMTHYIATEQFGCYNKDEARDVLLALNAWLEGAPTPKFRTKVV